MTITGNLEGVRRAYVQQVEEQLELLEYDRDQFAPPELLAIMADLTRQTRREVVAYMDRGGRIMAVTIGESWYAALEDMRIRRSLLGLSGTRCLHTHPNGDARLSPVDVQALIRQKYDAMAAIGVSEEAITGISAAFLGGEGGEPLLLGPVSIRKIPQEEWMTQIYLAAEQVQMHPEEDALQRDRAFLIGLGAEYENNRSMQELAQLADTADMDVLGGLAQNRSKMDAATYIGSGKAEEVMYLAKALGCNVVIADDELTASQMRALEKQIGVPVMDRTALILDIFARRAKSHEGKLQVLLAQLKYRMTHLIGWGEILSRQGAGAGVYSRGPGETRLEMDRRRIRLRITEVEKEIKELRRQRDIRRARREQNQVPIVSLVGYTNAGKSTLLNGLSGADVLVEDKLFATLDPVTRRVETPEGLDFLLVDTVGFIDKLPHDLVEAFRSTLEEVAYSDLLLTVWDASSPDRDVHKAVVDRVLAEVGAGDIPRLSVANKCDKAQVSENGPLIPVSAQTGMGMDKLLQAINQALASRTQRIEVLIPYDKGHLLGLLHEKGKVIQETYEAAGTQVTAVVDPLLAEKVCRMLEAVSV